MLENVAVELIIIQVLIKVYAKFGRFYEQHQSYRGRKPAKFLLVFAGEVRVLVCTERLGKHLFKRCFPRRSVHTRTLTLPAKTNKNFAGLLQ